MDFNSIVIAALLIFVPLLVLHMLLRRYREDANLLLRPRSTKREVATTASASRDTAPQDTKPAEQERTMAEVLQSARQIAPEVERLVKKGRRLEAVKLIRERTGLGLKEAKELVDKLA